MEFNPVDEYARLNQLIFYEKIDGFNSLFNYLDKCVFRHLPIRGSFLHIGDMLEYIELPEYIEQYTNITTDALFNFCELVFAIIEQGDLYIDKLGQDVIQQASSVRHQILYVLDKANHEFVEDSNGNNIIVEKNRTARQAAETVKDEPVAFRILEYNHFALLGDLQKKQDVLQAIGTYVEPKLNDKIFTSTAYKGLADDARFMLNNFNIRHNNKSGKSANSFMQSITDSELEQWYDKTYNTLLMLIIAEEQVEISNELKDIKSKHF
jgi:hypothetical protein